MWSYNYSDELYHFGIKGMKWGVRRYQNEDGTLTRAGKKRQAKLDYKEAKKNASERHKAAIEKADADYEHRMSSRTREVEGIKKTYENKKKAIDEYYKKEIEKYQAEVDEAQEDMDFFSNIPEGINYTDARDRYYQSSRNLQDAQYRYSGALYANKKAMDEAVISAESKYVDTNEKAQAKRDEEYAKAGEDYINSILAAKDEYKKARKEA